jgi:hypothetical protein
MKGSAYLVTRNNGGQVELHDARVERDSLIGLEKDDPSARPSRLSSGDSAGRREIDRRAEADGVARPSGWLPRVCSSFCSCWGLFSRNGMST